MDQGMAGLDQLVPDSAVSADVMQATSMPSSSNPGCAPQSLFPGERILPLAISKVTSTPSASHQGRVAQALLLGAQQLTAGLELYECCDAAAAAVQQASAVSLYALQAASCL